MPGKAAARGGCCAESSLGEGRQCRSPILRAPGPDPLALSCISTQATCKERGVRVPSLSLRPHQGPAASMNWNQGQLGRTASEAWEL